MKITIFLILSLIKNNCLFCQNVVIKPENFEGVWVGKIIMSDVFSLISGKAYSAEYTLSIAYSSKDSFFCVSGYKKAKTDSREILGIAYLNKDTLMFKEFSEGPFDKKGRKVDKYPTLKPTYENITAKLVLKNESDKKQLSGEAKTFVLLRGNVNVTRINDLPDKENIINKIHTIFENISIARFHYITSQLYNKKQVITENSNVRVEANIFNTSGYNVLFGDIEPHIQLLNDYHQSFTIDDFKDDGELAASSTLYTSKIFNAAQNLPFDSLYVKVSLAIGNITIKSRNFGVPVFNYFVTDTIRYPKENFSRFKAIASFFGTSGMYTDNIRDQFENMINDTTDNDKKNNALITQMWKSIFLYRGIGGYEKDEEAGKSMANFYLMPLYGMNAARAGDLESMYFAYCAYTMNVLGEADKEKAYALLDTAVKYKFPPAVYEKGLQFLADKNYGQAMSILKQAKELGIKRAAFQVALLYERGMDGKSVKDAIDIYDTLAKQHDVNALIRLADYYIAKKTSGNSQKGIAYLNKAIALNSATAMLYLCNLYTSGILTEPKQGIAFELLKKAASLHNKDAMFQLSLNNLYGKNAFGSKSDAVALLSEAAKMGQPEAMNLLGVLYGTGDASVSKDYFLSRYWLNQAKARGVGKGLIDSIIYTNPLETFIDGVVNYKPSIYYKVTTEYGHVLREGYADNDPLSVIAWGGLFNVFMKSLEQKQEIINDIRLLYVEKHHKVYGGILTSRFDLPEKVSAGQIINVSAFGNISVGDVATTLHGTTGPEGINNDRFLSIMSISPELPHGCVMAGVSGRTWLYVGKELNGYLIRGKDLEFGVSVNDAAYQNNQGYFDVKIDVYNFMNAANKRF